MVDATGNKSSYIVTAYILGDRLYKDKIHTYNIMIFLTTAEMRQKMFTH